jgi:hypothetical protein
MENSLKLLAPGQCVQIRGVVQPPIDIGSCYRHSFNSTNLLAACENALLRMPIVTPKSVPPATTGRDCKEAAYDAYFHIERIEVDSPDVGVVFLRSVLVSASELAVELSAGTRLSEIEIGMIVQSIADLTHLACEVNDD